MSTKTLRKRIALVAVSALGAGLLSVVAVPSANAATTAGLNNSAGATNADSKAGTMTLATQASTTGAGVSLGVAATARSMGLINVSDIAGGDVAGTTATATMLSSGALTFYTTTVAHGSANAADQVAVFTVSGGTLSAPNVAGTAGSSAINPTNTAVVFDSAAADVVSVVASPSAGSTTMIVRMYTASSFAAAAGNYGETGATAWAAALAAPTIGTLKGQITVTIAATSTAGVLSASTSAIYYSSANNDGANIADATTGTWSSKAPVAQFANIRVRDVYGTGLAAGLLQVTATGGALVNIDDDTPSAGTASSDFYTSTPDDTMLSVSAPSFAPLTTTVTVTYNGTVVGTKSFTFTGPVATITLGAPLRINNLATTTGTSTDKGAPIAFADSAGNAIYVGSSATGMTNYATSGFLVDAASDRSGILSVAPSTSSTAGFVDWGCNGISATTDNLIVSYLNVDGSIAKSAPLKVSCAGNAFTYTASYDKASYAPGEVAVLSVTFRDSKGNLANDITSWSSTLPVVTPGGGALAAITTTSDASTLGVKTYNVVTIVTEGTYQTVVNIPVVKVSNSSQKDVIAGFTLKSQSVGVSNADVLKAIVSLIASINKQIAALQKALLRR
jgi:hypothetical protein